MAGGRTNRVCQADNLARRRNLAMFLTIDALALPKSCPAAGHATPGGLRERCARLFECLTASLLMVNRVTP